MLKSVVKTSPKRCDAAGFMSLWGGFFSRELKGKGFVHVALGR